ncbi:hypothetical protein [Chitinivorax sp. B]|uniref:hypothetical protein n=1 Tax=Chitinivorax sp. B TaxID=2502235 RepID=UPI0014854C5E|nr:hypothetical protein [Chitinivorax sp. B]
MTTDYVYDGLTHRLIRQQDSRGLKLRYAYSAGGLLNSVEKSLGSESLILADNRRQRRRAGQLPVRPQRQPDPEDGRHS